jgi:putative peptidoglycan lipid II flippase
MKRYALVRIIGAVAVVNLLSRLIGFFREMLIGYHFGTSLKADSVIAAYTIPNFIYIAAGGAITTAFISIYTKTEGNVKHSFRQLTYTYSLFIFAVLSILFFLFPDIFIKYIFWGLSEEELSLTSQLFKWMGLSTFFLVLSMFLTGLLNTNERFKIAAFAPFINNSLFVLIAALFYPVIGIDAYAYGALIGAAVMFIVLLMAVKSGGFLDGSLHFNTVKEEIEYVKRFLFIAIPVLFGGATLQFYFLIHRVFASQLQDGAIAALNYSSKFVQLPQAILMTAVTTVIYPLIAKSIAKDDREKLNDLLNKGILSLILFMFPASVYVYLFSEEIITLLFEYGSFTKESTRQTAHLLQILVIGMFAHAMNVFLTRFYYAMERALLPVITGLIAVFGVNVGIVLLFMESFGEIAIAWGTTISAYSQMFILLIFMAVKLEFTFMKFNEISKHFLLLAVMISVGVLTRPFFEGISFLLVEISLSGLWFLALFLILGYLLKVKQIHHLVDKAKGWIR